MTVLVGLTGGLGNMLFQVAAGRDLAERRDDALMALPPATARDAKSRGRLWAALGEEIATAPDRLVARVERADRHRFAGYRVTTVTQKASQSFDPPNEWGTGRRVVVLRGYFQHPGFLGRQPELLAQQLHTWVAASLARPTPEVAIHLRRGDYLPIGWELPVAEYEGAVRTLMGLVPRSLDAVIVSDDPLAAEGLAARLQPLGTASGWTFRACDPRSWSEDFATLASAQHLIMSNSTFAWWAALVGDVALGRDSDRWVLAPGKWLGTRQHALHRPDWVPFGAGRPGTEA